MKKIHTTVFSLAFVLLVLPSFLAAGDEGSEAPIRHFEYASADGSREKGDRLDVHISYLLDQDGRPYILTIRTDDEAVHRMIYRMTGEKKDASNFESGRKLGIAFYYDNIQ